MSEKLIMFFMEKGKVLTVEEYMKLNPVPYPIHTLKQYFGSYPRAVNYAKFACKDAFAEIGSKAGPEVSAKKLEVEPAKKPAKEKTKDPLEALAGATKTEKSDD
jgi:hypothetical protein